MLLFGDLGYSTNKVSQNLRRQTLELWNPRIIDLFLSTDWEKHQKDYVRKICPVQPDFFIV